MQTDCIPDLFEFEAVEGRPVAAAFDGGSITSDAGAMLLGATDRAIGLIDRFAACFRDFRCPELIEHEVETLIGQRVFGLAGGYEDLIDHDQLRHDPMMAILAGKLKARREDCAPVAGKSTLNRLELSRPEPTRYHKISHDAAMIEGLLVDLFVEAHRSPPKQIVLDLDATDDPLHGHQEGLILPPPARIPDRPRPARRGHALTNQTAHSPHKPRLTAALRRPPNCVRNHAKPTANACRAISPGKSEPSKASTRLDQPIA